MIKDRKILYNMDNKDYEMHVIYIHIHIYLKVVPGKSEKNKANGTKMCPK